MLRINSNAANLDLTILGWIRKGEVRCPQCGSQWDRAVSDGQTFTDPLYGREANGRVCDHCGQLLVRQQALVTA